MNKNKNVILTPKAEGSRPKFSHVVLGSIVLLLAACGDEVTEVTEVTQVVGMQVVEEGDALPKCNTENEGQMVYSVDSAAAYYCVNRKWTSMKGKDGKDGKDGAAGKDGKDGKDGENGKDGKDGTNGSNGTNGSDGTSCTAVAIDNGYKIVCGEDSVGVVLNGAKGDKGADGKDGKIFVGGWMVDSRDSSLYRYVTIGSQVWMAENLNYKVDSSYCYNDSVEYCEKYGRLYKWPAAVGESERDCGGDYMCGLSGKVRGVCPEGWHLPDTTEWNTLFAAVGGMSTANKKLKSTSGWNDYEGESCNGTDAIGFSVLPAGVKNQGGDYSSEGMVAFFWSSTERPYPYAYNMYFSYRHDIGLGIGRFEKDHAFSVRCVKD